MGLLKEEITYNWEEIKDLREKIKESGIDYFISIYNQQFNNKPFYWGDEIEMMACVKDVLYKLMSCNTEICKLSDEESKFTVEFAGYMVESIPKDPYFGDSKSFESLELKFKRRQDLLNNILDGVVKGSFCLPMTCFPDIKRDLLSTCTGCKNCSEMSICSNMDFSLKKTSTSSDYFYGNVSEIKHIPSNCPCKLVDCSCLQRILDRSNDKTFKITKSNFFSDNKITFHRRFFSFVENIRNRRGKMIEGYIKIMKDLETKATEEKENDTVFIDSMGQGMGCCCLQVTLQAENFEEAKSIYDNFAILAPLFLRFSRATPFSNGYLLNTETRWDMLVFSVDCRTDEERGCEYNISGNEECLSDTSKIDSTPRDKKMNCIPKSRFSSVDLFLNPPNKLYNDIYYPTIEKYTQKLLDGGVDFYLSEHISSLFIRDPILCYKNRTPRDDFENIQTSNWRSVRLKLPIIEEEENLRGWKVEFRPMEIQITAKENAALTNFSVLILKAIMFYKLNLYIPISFVEINFKRANLFIRKPKDFTKKLIEDEMKFYYRFNIEDNGPCVIKQDTLNVIFNGNKEFIGLLHFVKRYVKEKCESEQINEQLKFISQKFEGEYLSTSDFLRKLVLNHQDYKQDSRLNDKIIDFLVEEVKKITEKNTTDYILNK